MKVKGNILFKEEQQFRGWFWWIVILVVTGSIITMVLATLREKEKVGEAWLAVAFAILIEVVLLFVMYVSRQETVITTEGVFYRWMPLQRSYWFVPLAEIKEASLRKGPALGYGLRRMPGYGTVHKTGPGKGFQFVLKSGKKIFLGTNKEKPFQQAIDKLTSITDRM